MNTKELIRKLEQMTELSESRNEFYKTLIHSLQNDADQQVYDKVYSNLCGLLAHGDLNNLKSATPFPKCYLHKEKWTFDS